MKLLIRGFRQTAIEDARLGFFPPIADGFALALGQLGEAVLVPEQAPGLVEDEAVSLESDLLEEWVEERGIVGDARQADAVGGAAGINAGSEQGGSATSPCWAGLQTPAGAGRCRS